jgi:hypothetical protein
MVQKTVAFRHRRAADTPAGANGSVAGRAVYPVEGRRKYCGWPASLRASQQHRWIAARDFGDQSIDIITGLQAATEIGVFGSQALRAWLFYRSQGLDVGWFALCVQFRSKVVLLGF